MSINKKKILIIWIGRLGDFAVSIKFINSLKQKYSSRAFTFIGTEKNYELAELTGLFNEIVIYPLKLNSPLKLLKIISIYIKHIFFKKYSLIIDLNPSYSNSSHYIMKYSKSDNKIGFYKKKTHKFLDIYLNINEEMSMRERYKKLAEKINLNYLHDYILPVNLETLLDKNNINIGIFPGNFNKTEHRWQEDKFVELTKLIQKNYHFNIIYISDKFESIYVKKRILTNLKNIKLFETENLSKLCAILKELNLLITNNTGPLHIAELVNTPTLSINSGYSYRIWAPQGDIHFHVYSDNSKTCRDISVERVFNEFENAVKKLNLSKSNLSVNPTKR